MATAAKEITVEGEVERVTFESEASGFRVLRVALDGVSQPMVVVGTFPQVGVGSRVRVRGEVIVDKKHGEQLKVAHITEILPNTLLGVERYLGSGNIKGVGPKTAQRIVLAFGLETLKVLDEMPERLAEVTGIGKKLREQIANAWREQRNVRDVMVFLQAHGASPALATRISKRYGDRAIDVVSRQPYRLALDVWGVGFKTADRIAKELGILPDSPQRAQAGVMQALHDATESGHTCATQTELIARAILLLEWEDSLTSQERAEHAIAALDAGRYVIREGDLLFPPRLHAAEERLAERVLELAHARGKTLEGAEEAISDFERRAQVELAPAQRDAVRAAASNSLLIVTGGPGVGKTTIVRAILAVLSRACIDVRLAAPTGRAAKRLSETTGTRATTLHRLLEFEPKRSEFKRNAQSPIDAGALIVDEASMIDLQMGDALFQAVARGTRVILVGDVDQLPSVGPGAVLRDLIASRAAPTVRLTHIFRQSAESFIVKNAHRINAGEAPLSPKESKDFFVMDRRDPEAARSVIVEMVSSRIPARFGLDPIRDVQVLTPMHRGAAGTLALNEALQAALNPHGPGILRGHTTLRLGDKVMQLRNDYDRDVFNGDVGVIKAVNEEEGSLTVRFDDARDVPYEAAALDELTLAYACSIHKSQGSEYPAVVIPLLTAHFVMLSRNLLYTAVTRGKRLVVLVADPRALDLALAEDRRNERRTRLESRLRGEAFAISGPP
ncbi:MAG: ATP-dependent RecD-like DNA helicase [Polyangiaceae bacterium]